MHQPIRQGRSWGRRFRRREWLDRSWLVVPSLYVLAALALGKAVPALESGNEIDPLGLALSTDSAREILNAVAGGMIAFTGLVVSVAVVVVQFGAGQYTPRLVLRFRRDLVVKHALGIFIAPALYALVALGELGAPGGDLRAQHHGGARRRAAGGRRARLLRPGRQAARPAAPAAPVRAAAARV